MAHLLVEQSRRLVMTLNEDDFIDTTNSNGGMTLRSLSESSTVCSVVFDAFTPTGNGRPKWRYIVGCILYGVAALYGSFTWLLPLLGRLLQRILRRNLAKSSADAQRKMFLGLPLRNE
mmetsp:Transcript_27731/g.41963  ORF Transcript_27731/g.41963 Transcript_27731/m.41963 type:complete len:118 (-) Transcript_27731:480-833(-)